MREPHLIAVDLRRGIAVRDDGAWVPVVKMYDFEGDETSDPSEAAYFIAKTPYQVFYEALRDYPQAAVVN